MLDNLCNGGMQSRANQPRTSALPLTHGNTSSRNRKGNARTKNSCKDNARDHQQLNSCRRGEQELLQRQCNDNNTMQLIKTNGTRQLLETKGVEQNGGQGNQIVDEYEGMETDIQIDAG